MKIKMDTLSILGTKVQGDNPLPVFRDAEPDKPSKGTALCCRRRKNCWAQTRDSVCCRTA